MERLAEQIVAWHNRHPLARRITVGDVHTIGVVALPFLRGAAKAGGLVEPVLTDEVGFDELAAAPRVSFAAAWAQRFQGLFGRLGRKPQPQWRAFNEKFLPGLSPARIERFALAHGFAEPPATQESKPWRVIVIDEALAAAKGGWPFELYLMSAGIDVGSARTRVLSGRGIPSQVIGRRLMDPKRLALAGAAVAALLVAGALAAWLRLAPAQAPHAEPAAPAASAPAAASAAVLPASAPPAEPAPPAATAASATASGAVTASEPASAVPPDEEASGPPPDIRPRFAQRTDGIVRPPLRSTPASERAAEKPAEKAAEKLEKTAEKSADKPAAKATEKAAEKAAEKPAEKPTEKAQPADPRLSKLAQPGQTVVALVGPPGTKAEAQALLKKMQAGLVGVHNNPESLQGDVIETPEGWRATVWPFATREQAALINATLVARGMRTKAVNF